MNFNSFFFLSWRNYSVKICIELKIAVYFFATLSALGLLVVITPNNLGFSPDSMAYLEVAENLTAGKGITSNSGGVIHHWPPLFPVFLAVVSQFTGIVPFEVGLFLQPVLFFLFLVLFYNILKQLEVGAGLAIFAVILCAFSPVSKNFLWYLSEGLFLVLLLVSFYFFLKWQDHRTRKYLVLTGISCGLFILTRYAGIGFIGGYLLFILLQYKENFRYNFRDSVILIGSCVLVIIPWFLYLNAFEVNPGGRSLGVHLISLSKLIDFVKTIGYWFLGGDLAKISVTALVTIYVIRFWRVPQHLSLLFTSMYCRYKAVILISLCLILVYSLFLILSISFYDSWTPLNNRMLSPIFPFLLLLIILLLQILKKRNFNFIFYGTLVVIFLSFSSSVLPYLFTHFNSGSGYTKSQWRQSGIVNYLKKNQVSNRAYSNGIELVKLHNEKNIQLFPGQNETAAIAEMITEVRGRKADIVYFNEVNWRNYLVSKERLLEEFQDLCIVFFEDGFIIRNPTSE